MKYGPTCVTYCRGRNYFWQPKMPSLPKKGIASLPTGRQGQAGFHSQ
jgi:hypothetical protein